MEIEVLSAAKQEESERHRAHGAHLSQQARLQMARNVDKVEHARQQNLQKGLRVKAETQARRQLLQREKEEWIEKGRELAQKDRQQKARIKEVVGLKSHRVAERTAVFKQEELDFERQLRLVRDRLVLEKRAGAAGVRALTSDDVIDTAKKFAYEQRKEVANSTRNAQQTCEHMGLQCTVARFLCAARASSRLTQRLLESCAPAGGARSGGSRSKAISRGPGPIRRRRRHRAERPRSCARRLS